MDRLSAVAPTPTPHPAPTVIKTVVRTVTTTVTTGTGGSSSSTSPWVPLATLGAAVIAATVAGISVYFVRKNGNEANRVAGRAAAAAKVSADAAKQSADTMVTSARQLDERTKHQGIMLDLHWAADHAMSKDPVEARLGVAQLVKLGRSDLLASEQAYVDAALIAAVRGPKQQVEQIAAQLAREVEQALAAAKARDVESQQKQSEQAKEE